MKILHYKQPVVDYTFYFKTVEIYSGFYYKKICPIYYIAYNLYNEYYMLHS